MILTAYSINKYAQRDVQLEVNENVERRETIVAHIQQRSTERLNSSLVHYQSKVWKQQDLFNVLTDIISAYYNCIYLKKNTVKFS